MDGNKIGVRIMQLRDERGESQEDVAKGIGESRETVRNWEVGTRKIKAESIIKLSKHFGVTADYLLGLSAIKTPNCDVHAACEYTGLSEAAVLTLNKIKDDGAVPLEGGANINDGVRATEVLSDLLVQNGVLGALILLSDAKLCARSILKSKNNSVKDYFDSEDAYILARYSVKGTGIRLFTPVEIVRVLIFESKQLFSNAIDAAFREKNVEYNKKGSNTNENQSCI